MRHILPWKKTSCWCYQRYQDIWLRKIKGFQNATKIMFSWKTFTSTVLYTRSHMCWSGSPVSSTFFPWQQRRKLCQITEQTYISNCGRCHSDFVFYVSEYLWHVRPTAASEVCWKSCNGNKAPLCSYYSYGGRPLMAVLCRRTTAILSTSSVYLFCLFPRSGISFVWFTKKITVNSSQVIV